MPINFAHIHFCGKVLDVDYINYGVRPHPDVETNMFLIRVYILLLISLNQVRQFTEQFSHDIHLVLFNNWIS